MELWELCALYNAAAGPSFPRHTVHAALTPPPPLLPGCERSLRPPRGGSSHPSGGDGGDSAAGTPFAGSDSRRRTTSDSMEFLRSPTPPPSSLSGGDGGIEAPRPLESPVAVLAWGALGYQVWISVECGTAVAGLIVTICPS